MMLMRSSVHSEGTAQEKLCVTSVVFSSWHRPALFSHRANFTSVNPQTWRMFQTHFTTWPLSLEPPSGRQQSRQQRSDTDGFQWPEELEEANVSHSQCNNNALFKFSDMFLNLLLHLKKAHTHSLYWFMMTIKQSADGCTIIIIFMQ